jgi:assimilatory nitrate reductase catalytic subunit
VFPTPDGRARFSTRLAQPVAEPRDARYPFSLTTGRLRDQWHGMSRTGTLGRLFGHVPEPGASTRCMCRTWQRRGLQDGDLVHVHQPPWLLVVPVQASTEHGAGQAFMAMHWGPEYLGGCASTGERLAGVNALTSPAYCPSSRQPELKHAAVKVLRPSCPGPCWAWPGCRKARHWPRVKRSSR